MGLESKFIHIIESNFNHSKCIHIYIIHDIIHGIIYMILYIDPYMCIITFIFPPAQPSFVFFLQKIESRDPFEVFIESMYRALARPYAQAIAGNFSSSTFGSESGTFRSAAASVGSMGRWTQAEMDTCSWF